MFIPHKPWYFEVFTDYYDQDGNVIGFSVNKQIYIFDENGGWADQQGCYYSSDCTPNGWMIPDGKDAIIRYDQDQKYLTSYKLANLEWLVQQENYRKKNQQAAKQMEIIAGLGWNLMKIDI